MDEDEKTYIEKVLEVGKRGLLLVDGKTNDLYRMKMELSDKG